MAHKSMKYEYYLFMSVLIFYNVRANSTELQWKLQQYEEYQAKIDSRRILEYGAWCNTHAEYAFTEISTSLDETTNGNSLPAFEAELDKINAAYEKLFLYNHNFCNPVKLLTCDKSTNFCNCGPQRFRNQEFKYVQDSNGQCLYAKNTACYPNYHLPGKHYNCENNTNCVFMDTTGEKIYCDLPNFRKAKNADTGIVKCYCRDDTFLTTYYDGPAINSVSITPEMCNFCLIVTLFFSIYS